MTLCSLVPLSACVISGDDDDSAGNTTVDDSTVSDTDSGSESNSNSGSDPSTTASTTDPSTTDPGTTDPGTTNPGTTDPGTTNPGTTDPGTTTPTTDADTSDSGDSVDDTAESGADVDPQDGLWQYEEEGQGTNECTFIDDPSNGFGQYLVANTGPGAFTITPGDGSDPFTCAHGGGAFDCDERLTGTLDIGMGVGNAMGNILVGIEGTLESAVSMVGEQQGRIECEGGDCGTAEQFLGVTFPCEFTIPFVGTAL